MSRRKTHFNSIHLDSCEAEITDLFGPPTLNSNDQRCMFVVLLGYFKVKPITLNPGYHQIMQDIKCVCSEVFPGSGLSPFNLTRKARVCVYNHVLEATRHQRRENEHHGGALTTDLIKHAQAGLNRGRYLTGSLNTCRHRELAYPDTRFCKTSSVMSSVVTNDQLVRRLNDLISVDLAVGLLLLVDGKD